MREAIAKEAGRAKSQIDQAIERLPDRRKAVIESFNDLKERASTIKQQQADQQHADQKLKKTIDAARAHTRLVAGSMGTMDEAVKKALAMCEKEHGRIANEEAQRHETSKKRRLNHMQKIPQLLKTMLARAEADEDDDDEMD